MRSLRVEASKRFFSPLLSQTIGPLRFSYTTDVVTASELDTQGFPALTYTSLYSNTDSYTTDIVTAFLGTVTGFTVPTLSLINYKDLEKQLCAI